MGEPKTGERETETAGDDLGEGPVLLSTKLNAPAHRRELVPRQRLIAELAQATLPMLTLIDAPAGWGKTTLLGEWSTSEQERRPFVWVAIDDGDNDPVRFWTYIVEALRRHAPDIGASALALLRSSGVRVTESVLPELINEIEGLSEEVVLALDDYHLITNEEIHEAITFLLEHIPAPFHVVLSTRSDPPLPLPRWRVRRQMLEIRAEGLRFSESETEELFNDVLRLGLDADAVRLLHERTEGWAAGLYLAALSLQGRTDTREFIEAFAGDDRHVVDYLGSEVLQGQPETARDFLIRTSILHRLSGALCDAVTDTTGSTRMLEEIERSNHFLISLDDKRQWYRYHHLFAELLLHELERTEAHLKPVLHSRASAWHEQQGFIAESIHHAVAAGETLRASELIAAHWNSYFNQGRLETVASWLDALPPKVVAADTRLCLARVWLAMDLGRLDEAETWIGDAEQALAQTTVGEGAESLEVDTALVRALHRYKVGDIARSIQEVRALERKPDISMFARTVMSCIQGVTLFWAGETAGAGTALKEAVRLARIDGNALATVYALGYLAAIRAEQGELLEADRLVAEAMTLSREPTVAEHFVTMMVHLARGRVSEQRGELTNALPAMERAVELSRRGAGRTELAYALLSLARLRHSQGDLEQARELLDRARGIADRCPDPGVLEAMLARVERATRRVPASAGPRPYVDQELSDRELAILRLLPSELSQRDIGAALYISLNTVKTHTRGIFRKLDASNRQEAVARARERGLL